MSRSSAVVVTILAPGNSRPQFLQRVYRGTIEEEQDPGLVLKVLGVESLGIHINISVF